MFSGMGLAQVAGALDHFTFSSPPARVEAGTPFPVTIEAKDAFGNRVTAYGSTINIVASAPQAPSPIIISEVDLSSKSRVELVNPTRALQDVSGWQVLFYNALTWPNPYYVYVLPAGTRCKPGEVFQIWGGNPAPGNYPNLYLGTSLNWQITSSASFGVIIRDANGGAVDAVTYYFNTAFPITSPEPLPDALWQGTLPIIRSGVLTYQRVGGFNHHNAADWVAATNTVGTLHPLCRVPFVDGDNVRSVTPGRIAFTNGVWSGWVTVPEPGASLALRVDDAEGHPGQSERFTLTAQPPLTLDLPALASERTPGTSTAHVGIPTALQTDAVVSLTSSSPARLGVPASVLIPAGGTKVDFAVTNYNDGVPSGTQRILVGAQAPGFTSAQVVVVNEDADTGQLFIKYKATSKEGDGMILGGGSVYLTNAASTDMLVQLASSDPAAVQVQPAVTIPAGQTNAFFDVTLPDDGFINGLRQATLTAHMANWTDGSVVVNVRDNETAKVTFSMPSLVFASGGKLTNAGSVSISGIAGADTTVLLSAQPENILGFPKQLTIPAGATSVSFDLDVLATATLAGSINVDFTAITFDTTNGNRRVRLFDDRLARFAVSTSTTSCLAGQPVPVSVNARNASDETIPNLTGNFTLTVRDGNGTAQLPPMAVTFTNGVRAGSVTVAQESLATRVFADDQGGHTGASTKFDVASIRVVTLGALDVAYDRKRGALWVGTSSSAGGLSNSLVAIDPATAAVGSVIHLESQPARLAISDDGHYLYAGLRPLGGIVRIDLDTLGQDLSFSLGPTNTVVGGTFAEDLKVMPGKPRTVLVSTRLGNESLAVGVFDDGVPRRKTAGPSSIAMGYYVEFASETEAYEMNGGGFRKLQIDASGVTILYECNTAASYPDPAIFQGMFGGEMIYDSGFLYANSGLVLRTEPLSRAGRFPVAGYMAPDRDSGRAFFIIRDNLVPRLEAFSLGSYELLGSLEIPQILGSPGRLVRCGGNRLAFPMSEGQICIVSTALVPDQAGSRLAVAQTASATQAVVGESFTYTITVTNPGPAVVQNPSLWISLPTGAELVSLASHGMPWKQTNESAFCELPALQAGSAASVELTIRPTSPGTLVNAVQALGGLADVPESTARQTNVAVFNTTIPPVTLYAVNAADVAYDSVNDRLLACVGWNAEGYPNQLFSLDMASGVLSAPTHTADFYRRLAVSDDGKYLFAATFPGVLDRSVTSYGTMIHRVNLETLHVENSFYVLDKLGQQLEVADMRAVPRDSSAVAVDRGDIAIYRNGTEAAHATIDGGVGFFQFSATDPTRIYATSYGPDPGLHRLRTGPSSVTWLSGAAGLLSPWVNNLESADSRLYSSAGDVIDPEAGVLIGRLAPSEAVMPDPRVGLVFAVRKQAAEWLLEAYDIGSLKVQWRFPISGMRGTPQRLFKCRPGVLAMLTAGGQLYILNTRQLPPKPFADLAVTQTCSPQITPVPTPVTFTIHVTNLGPSAATDVLLTDPLPQGASVHLITTTQGSCVIDSGIAHYEVGTLEVGASATLILGVNLPTGGAITNRVEATLSQPDLNPADNSSTVKSSAPRALASDVSLLDITTGDLVYDPASRMIFASSPADAPFAPNTILSVDPVRGNIESVVAVGLDPGKLAISDDGSCLYVALNGESAIQRIRLSTMTADLKFSIGTGYSVEDMVVQPGHPGTLAVARGRLGGTPFHQAVTVYSDGAALPNSVRVPVYANLLAFSSDPGTLYGFDRESGAFNVQTMKVDASGVTLAKSASGVIVGDAVTIRFADGLLYASSGEVADPVQSKRIWRFDGVEPKVYGYSGSLVVPDAQRHLAYYMTPGGSAWQIKSGDPSNFTFQGALDIPDLAGTPASLIRWGEDGLAFRTSAGQLYICRTGNVQAVDLAVAQTVTAANTPSGTDLTYFITVTNQGLRTAGSVVVDDGIPSGALYLSHAPSQGSAVMNGFTSIRWGFGPLRGGESATLSLTLRVPAPGYTVNKLVATCYEVEPVLSNNVSILATALPPVTTSDVITRLSMSATALAYDPVGDQLLMAIGGMNGILRLNTGSLAAVGTIPLEDGIRRMLVSQDGAYLYAVTDNSTGVIDRISMPSGTLGLRIALQPAGGPQPVTVYGMAIMPGAPETIAVSRYAGAIQSAVAIYDGNSQRPTPLLDGAGGSRALEFAGSADVLVGFNGQAGFDLRRMGLSANGATLINSVDHPEFGSFMELRYDEGKLYTSSGFILVPTTLEVVGRFPGIDIGYPANPNALVLPDTRNGVVYYLTQESGAWALRGFDPTTLVQLWRMAVPGVVGATADLCRSGVGKLAFRDAANHVFVVRVPAASATPTADLSVSCAPTSITNINAGGRGAWSWAVTNNGPWNASNVIVSVELPPGLVDLAANATQGTTRFEANTLRWQLGALTSAASATISVSGLTTTSGSWNITAAVTGEPGDTDTSNNTVSTPLRVLPQPRLSVQDTIRHLNPSLPSVSVGVSVTLSAPSTEPITFAIATSDGSAVATQDYTPYSAVGSIAPGRTNTTVTVQLTYQKQPTPERSFFINIDPASISNAVPGRTQAAVTIINNRINTLAVTTTNITENNAGLTNVVFNVTLSGAGLTTVSVDYKTIDGTGVAGLDYLAKSGTLIFPPGVTNRTVSVPVFADPKHAPQRVFYLLLSNPVNALLGIDELAATVVGNPPPTPLMITALDFVGDDARVSFNTDTGKIYRLEGTEGFETPVWAPVGNGIVGNGTNVLVLDPGGANHQRRFYRVRIP